MTHNYVLRIQDDSIFLLRIVTAVFVMRIMTAISVLRISDAGH
jgi:hypothetical protein